MPQQYILLRIGSEVREGDSGFNQQALGTWANYTARMVSNEIAKGIPTLEPFALGKQ